MESILPKDAKNNEKHLASPKEPVQNALFLFKEAHHHLERISHETREVQQHFVQTMGTTLVRIALEIAKRLQSGSKLLIFGNGGSAADAQHFAAELVGQLLIPNRKPLAAIALTTDSSNITAIANDFHFDAIFERQIIALGNPQDIAFGISTSGNSKNVIQGLIAAEKKGMYTIGLTGGTGGQMQSLCKEIICVAQGKNSCRIQESHIFAIHAVVDLIEKFFYSFEEC